MNVNINGKSVPTILKQAFWWVAAICVVILTVRATGFNVPMVYASSMDLGILAGVSAFVAK